MFKLFWGYSTAFSESIVITKTHICMQMRSYIPINKILSIANSCKQTFWVRTYFMYSDGLYKALTRYDVWDCCKTTSGNFYHTAGFYFKIPPQGDKHCSPDTPKFTYFSVRWIWDLTDPNFTQLRWTSVLDLQS